MSFTMQLLFVYPSLIKNDWKDLALAFSPNYVLLSSKNAYFRLVSPEKSSAELFEIRPGLLLIRSIFTASP